MMARARQELMADISLYPGSTLIALLLEEPPNGHFTPSAKRKQKVDPRWICLSGCAHPRPNRDLRAPKDVAR